MRISIDNVILEKYEGIRLAYTIVNDVKVETNSKKSEELLSYAEKETRDKYKLEYLKDEPIIRSLRDFYWRIGIDPTKQRPSSEALVRRVLKGKPIPRINNVVDAGNAASMLTLIPIGLYDLGKINGNLLLRHSKRGEVFKGIGGKNMVLTGNEIVLADQEKILHIFPYRDSRDTMITTKTNNVLVIGCGVKGIDESRIKEAAALTRDFIIKVAGGTGSEVILVFR